MFGAGLPRSVVPKIPCVRAVMATVASEQTTLANLCGPVRAVTLTATILFTGPRRPQKRRLQVSALRKKAFSPGTHRA